LQREQLRDHEERVARMESELDDHRKNVPERGAKALTVQNHKEKDAFMQFEVIFYLFIWYLIWHWKIMTDVKLKISASDKN
jgi:PH and SEC7 domain-containing protein